MRTVLDLSGEEALSYFMEPQNFCSLVLPPYIDFSQILEFAKTKIGKKGLETICITDEKKKPIEPKEYDDVNYKLLVNKDGKYSFRPMQISNPYLYYLIVREITQKSSWIEIQNRFKFFHDDHIFVSSIPPIKEENDKTQIATAISSWWTGLEQESIKLSLEYKYMFVTDITNCYGSIYTHSIPWALMGKDNAKKNRSSCLANKLDMYIRNMQYGQTNGIPQGSTLYDFIAEMVLGYADKLLAEEIAKKKYEYRILRYRDDYRIFSNRKDELDDIVLVLSSVLAQLNMQLNASKTRLSDNIVEDSIKPDKLFYISNTPIYKKRKRLISQFNSYQKELYYILEISKKYPNSGIIIRLMTSLNQRTIASNIDKNEEDVGVLIALITEIVMYSPKVYQSGLALISKFLEKCDDAFVQKYINLVHSKLSRLPNIGHIQLWMQRLTIKTDRGNRINPYDEKLCKLVYGDEVSIWNNDWLKEEYQKDFPVNSLCNNQVIDKMSPYIMNDEYEIFDY